MNKLNLKSLFETLPDKAHYADMILFIKSELCCSMAKARNIFLKWCNDGSLKRKSTGIAIKHHG